MSALWLILLTSASVYVLRVSGLQLQSVRIPDLAERTLRFAPVALVSALAASSLANQAQAEPLRLIAAVGAAGLVLYTHRMWAGILGGFGLYWLLRILMG